MTEQPPAQAGASRRRPRRLALALVAAAAVVLGALVGGCLAAARADLVAARALASDARDDLLASQADQARRGFDGSTQRFRHARVWLANPAVGLVAALPWAGTTVDALDELAEAGALTAEAGGQLATAVEQAPGGLGALVPSGGTVPLAPLERLHAPLAAAAERVRRAEALVAPARGTSLAPPVTRARGELTAQLQQLRPGLDAAAALSRRLPAFLGAHGPRRYFVGAANPAELRGAGGFLGAYAILTADGGRLELGPFTPIETLPSLPPGAVPAPDPSYATRYDRDGGAGFWLNINMTPDFPSAATAIERLYERVAGQRLDGTIVVDPVAFAALLEATGPADVPGVGTVQASDVVAFVSNEAYAQVTDTRARKGLLGAVAAGVLQRLLAGVDPARAVDAGRALAQATAGGHLLLHAADAEVQDAFETAQVSGRLLDPPGDFVAVVGNNAAANKADFYARRTLRYRARLDVAGGATVHARVGLANEAPDSGEPTFVIGPNHGDLQAGENVTLLSVYLSAGASLHQVTRDGHDAAVSAERELGHPVFTSRVRLPSGASTELGYEWTTPRAWYGDADGGTYRLTVQGQPTLRPTRLELAVDVPDGMRVVRASPGLRVDGARVTWVGEAPRLVTFEVTFARPWPQAVWRSAREVLARPLLGLVTARNDPLTYRTIYD